MSESFDKRIGKIENRLTRLETRVDNKHDDIQSLSRQINEERKDISELIATIKELNVLLKENNKETSKNSQDIEGLQGEVLELKTKVQPMREEKDKFYALSQDVTTIQSTLSNIKWVVGVGMPILTGVIVFMITEWLRNG